MQKRMAFVWDFSVDPVELYSWRDGLNEALQVLANKYGWEVKVLSGDNPSVIYSELGVYEPDVILAWGSLDRPSFAGLKEFGVPVGLCFAGGTTEHTHLDNFDIVFVENEAYKEQFEKQGINVVKAFGTNDKLFAPKDLSKHWDAIYPAAFAGWKRHNIFAEALGNKGLAIGKVLPDDPMPIQHCLEHNVAVIPAVPYIVLPYLYNQSHSTVITSATMGGSQRAVLESMACNIPPIVMSDNEKTSEYVEDSGYGYIVEPNPEAISEAIEKAKNAKKTGRTYIEQNYSAEKYADKLYNGLIGI